MSAVSEPQVSQAAKPVFVGSYDLTKLQQESTISTATVSEEMIQERVLEAWKLIDWEEVQQHVSWSEFKETIFCIERYKEVIKSVSTLGGGFIKKSVEVGLYRTLFINKAGDIYIKFEGYEGSPMQGIFKRVKASIVYGSPRVLAFATTKIEFHFDLHEKIITSKEKIKSSCRNEEVFGMALKGTPHVADYHEVVYYRGKDVKKQGIIMPYFDSGTLEEHEGITFPTELMYRVTLGILNGVAAIHEMGIIHRDIKTRNIMIHKEHSSRGKVEVPYIIDFGLAIHEGDLTNFSEFLGTPAFVAPEVHKYFTETDAAKKKELLSQITTKVDVYALGIVLGVYWLNLQPGQCPTSKKINENYRYWKEPNPKTKKLLHLIWSMTRDDPAERPTCKEAVVLFQRIILCDVISL